jgi:hypothetical protein
MSKEDRQLEITIAQLSADLQIYIAWLFGSLGGVLALTVFSAQIWATFPVVGFVSILVALFLIFLMIHNV